MIVAKVLVIEEYQYLRALYFEELKEQGYDVDLVADGNEALTRLEMTRFDIVVLNTTGRRTNATEVMRRIRILKPRIPIILTTLNKGPENGSSLRGAEACLVKWFDPGLLRTKIQKLLANSCAAALQESPSRK
jgi:DNA-binding response OmpR family regulator